MRFYLSLFLLLCFAPAMAQKGQGKLTGKISDAATNEPLAGVSISARSIKAGTSSITDGTYIFSLPPGTYLLRYSYTGFKTKEITGVVIKAGESTFLDIILDPSTKQLENVVVTASLKRETQSSVYSAQKRSSAVSDGISQESIRRTPDNNAAQVLTRVTGVNIQNDRFVVVRGLGEQYNQTMLNGVPMTSTETNRNAFAFDLIPAAVVDNIVVNKTATPDMPGNFAGGVVQVNTKDFPDKNFFSVNLQGGWSDGTYGNDFISDKRGKNEWLGFSGNYRDLPPGFPTATSRVRLTELNYQEQLRYLGMLRNTLIRVNNGKSGLNDQVQLGYGKTFKLKDGTQFGIVAALNQRKNELIEDETVVRQPRFFTSHDPDIILTQPPAIPDSLLGFGLYSKNKRYNYTSNFGAVLNLAYRFGNNKITLKNLYTSTFRNTYIDRNIFFQKNFDIQQNVDLTLPGVSFFAEQKSIKNSTLSGEHRTGKGNETRLDWNVNYTSNTTNTPDSRNFVLSYDTVNKTYSTNTNPFDITQSLSEFSRTWAHTNDAIYGGAFNVTTPFVFLNNKQLFKSGILFQNRERKATGSILPTKASPAVSIDSLLNPGNTSIDVAQGAFAQGGGNYNAGSSLLAVYESLENKIGKDLRVIWGLRVEDYQQNVNVYQTLYNNSFQDPDLISQKFAARTTFNFLPSVNLVYNPLPALNIRLAYSKTVIRPELKDLAPYASFDFTNFLQTQGNSELKSSSIANYDLKLEWFPSSGEIMSLAAFNKNIKDPIEYAVSTGDRNDIRYAYNTGNAYVRGLEAEIRKKLNFIPFAPWLSHVSVFGNGTLLQSKVSGKKINSFVLSSFGEHALTGQAKYIINAGMNILLFNDNFETTLSFNKTGDYNNELGSSDLGVHLSNGNVIPLNPHYRVKSRNLADIVSSIYFLKRKGQLKFKVSNLFKQPYILYQDLNGNGKFDGPARINTGTFKDASGFPTRYDENSNYKAAGNGPDNAASSILAQRTFAFSLAYTF